MREGNEHNGDPSKFGRLVRGADSFLISECAPSAEAQTPQKEI